MLLETLIPPRRDGTLALTGKSGAVYPLTPSGEGTMIGEVGDDDALDLLNRSEDFFPSRDEDVAKLIELRRAAAPADPVDLEDDDPDGGQGEPAGGGQVVPVVDLEDDDPIDPNALPVEANTPPAAPAPTKAAKAKAARG